MNKRSLKDTMLTSTKRNCGAALWIEKWTMQNEYPPRLRVIGWSAYHSYAEIESGLRSLERGIAKVQSIGETEEKGDKYGPSK